MYNRSVKANQVEAKDFLGSLTPLQKARSWFEDAQSTVLMEPSAMVLSTVNGQGEPSSRVVLCKDFRDDGFVFFTNYQSHKGEDLQQSSKVALNFFWDPLKHQILVRGLAEKLPSHESDKYWNNRLRDSQIAQHVSKQSQPVDSRATMEQEFQNALKNFGSKSIPRPPHWGGFIVKPTYVEFWIGREMRFHDRFAYHKVESGWQGERLYP